MQKVLIFFTRRTLTLFSRCIFSVYLLLNFKKQEKRKKKTIVTKNWLFEVKRPYIFIGREK